MNNSVFLKAFWESPQSALIFLTQDWDSESTRLPLFLSPEKTEFTIERASSFDVARLSGYYIYDDKIRFLIDPANYPELDLEENIYVGGLFNDWEKAIGEDKYLLRPFEMDGNSVFVIDLPLSVLDGEVTSYFRFVTENNRWLNVPENAPNLVPNRFQGADFSLCVRQSGRHVFRIRTAKEVNLQSHINVAWRDGQKKDSISISNAEFYLSLYSDRNMGVISEEGKTVFRIFAPRASRVTLELFRTLKNPDKVRYQLEKNKDGSWEVAFEKNYDRWFYFYYIDGINYDGSTYFDSTIPVVDPYAKAMASSIGPGIVVPEGSFAPLNDGFHPHLWHDLVITEVHLRDLMKFTRFPISKSERTQYTGMAKWLRSEGNYLKTLGINAIEFQPLHEFEYESKEEYHWGYMPVNYFSPASANEKYPKSGAQMKNLQDVVRACHEQGFTCILDVVYNHLGSPNALYSIDKHYYFESDSSFNLTNWSGVGNDIRARGPMVKKLIIDSLKYYVTHYGFDGFRFDLAELLGQNVLMEIERELKAIKPSVVLIAEPWSFRGHIAEKMKTTGFSSWNDRYRNFFIEYLKGEGSPMELAYFLRGSPVGLTRFPAQTVNYSESHDDYCWMDLITENPNGDGSQPTTNDIRRTHLMFSMLFLSLGIPMISAGQDYLRSKKGIRNTYQNGDVNALDYCALASNSLSHDYVREWIAFRLSGEGSVFRLEHHPNDSFFKFVYANHHGRGLATIYNADKSHGPNQYVYAINPTTQYQWFNMEKFKMGEATQIADHMRFNRNGLNSALLEIKDNNIVLPPLTCGLWRKS